MQTKSFVVDAPHAQAKVDYLLSLEEKILAPSVLELFDELQRISPLLNIDVVTPSSIDCFARSGGPSQQHFEQVKDPFLASRSTC